MTLNVSQERWSKVVPAAVHRLPANFVHHAGQEQHLTMARVIRAALLELKIEIKVSDG